MTLTETFLRLFAGIKPMMPALVVSVAVTIFALAFLLFFGKNIWVRDKRFKIMGLFFSIGGKGAVCLASSWLKLIFLGVFLIGFQKLQLINYFMILMPGIILIVFSGKAGDKLSSALYLFLELLGLISANLVCGYIRDMSGSLGFVLVYVAMSVFLMLFGIYLFLNEVAAISLDRKADPERIWNKDAE